MLETHNNNISKEALLRDIMREVNAIPLVYYKTLHALIHSFRENIPSPAAGTPTELEEDFDWEALLDEIHDKRRENNDRMRSRVDAL